MDIEAINQGLAAAGVGVSGLSTASWLPAVINNPPLFCPVSLELDPQVTFTAGGIKELDYTLAILCSAGDQSAGRLQLQKILSTGAQSIIVALYADKTLGGACSSLVAGRFQNINDLLEVGGIQYFSAELDVKVWAT